MVGCRWYLHIRLIIMRQKVDLRSRSQGQRSRSNMQFCIKTCFGYIPWTNDCILMMHIHMISIVEMLKLTKGQGHKVKGQGQICDFVKKLVSTIYQEQMNESWSKSYIGLISMRCWSWPKVKVTRSKVKVKSTILWKIYFDYKPWLDDRNMMVLRQVIDINE